jgi:uncharacterized alpha-E superfamily protein
MLSRVANSVYWMSRYVERAENVARFIDVNYNLTLGHTEPLREQWAPLVYTTGDHELFAKRYDAATRENVLRFLAFDTDNPNSILSCLQQARENARTIREVISSAMWEETNKFFHMARSAARDPAVVEQPYEFCSQVRRASHLLVGATDATMSHSEAWHFGRMGRLLERADKTSRIVDVQYFILLPDPKDVGTTLDVVRWSALLKSASALEMYRRVHGRIVPAKVAEFLLLDPYFPRSIRFCLTKAHASLHRITGSEANSFTNRSEQRLGMLRAEVDYTSVGEIIDRGMHEFIDHFQTRLNQIGDAIYEDFFEAKGPAPRAASSQSQSQGAGFQTQTQNN